MSIKYICIAIYCLFCGFSVLAQFQTDITPYTERVNFESLEKSDDGKMMLDKYPFLSSYSNQLLPQSTMQTRKIARMPNIGLYYEHDKEAKTSYVPNNADGWYLPDLKYYVGIYGKHYRKNKDKKGNRHKEQRLYKIVKMKAISHVDINFVSPAWMREIYDIRELVDGKAMIVGFAAMFTDREDETKKRLVFFDNEMKLQLDKSFESRQKKMFIYDILKEGDTYAVFNSSSAGFLKKGDGDAKYEVNVFNNEIVTTAKFDLPSQYNTIVSTRIKQMVKLEDNSIFMLGNLIYVDANQDDNPEKNGNLFYVHLAADGKVISKNCVPVKTHSEPNIYYFDEEGSHVVIGVENSNSESSDMVITVNKDSGKINTFFSASTPQNRFIYKDPGNGTVKYCLKDNIKKEVRVTTIPMD